MLFTDPTRREGVWVTALLLLALFSATILLVPNGLDIRLQHTPNFTFAMTVAAGVYIFATIDVLLGLLVLWACFQLFSGGPRTDEYIIFALCAFFIAVVKTRSHWLRHQTVLYDFVMLLTTICVGFQIMQLFDLYYFMKPVFGSYIGLMGNQDDTSCVLAVMLPVFLRKGRLKWLWIPILGLLLAKAWMGIVAAGVILFLYSLSFDGWKKTLLLWMAIFIGLAVFGYSVKPFDLAHHKTDRGDIWRSSVVAAMVKPFSGWGFAQYGKVIPLLTASPSLTQADREALWLSVRDRTALMSAAVKLSGGDADYFRSDKQHSTIYFEAHNDFIEWLFVSGLIGATLLLLNVSWSLLWSLRKGIIVHDWVPFYGLIASCICAAFFFSWQIMPTQALTIFYLGVVHS